MLNQVWLAWCFWNRIIALLAALLVCTGASQTASAGLVGIDRQMPPIGDWAYEQLKANRSQFAAASQLYAAGKLEQCQALLEKLCMANPALPPADLVIVWLQLNDHKLPQAKLRLESLSAALPRDPQVALTLGQIALAESRLADAAAQLERASLLQLPEAWLRPQRESFARTTLDTLAITYERQARWADAKTILTTLLAMGDQDLQYTNRLARAHYNLNELDQAQELLEKVAKHSAGQLPVPLLLAELAFSSGRTAEAHTAIQQAARQYPDNPEVQLWLAEWSLMDNDTRSAHRALSAAKPLGQQTARYWISLGQCQMLEENYAQAIEAFRQAVALLQTPEQPQQGVIATNLLALSLISQASPSPAEQQEALSIAERNALAYSTDPIHVATLGWIYFKLQRNAEAEPLLQRALELAPRVTSDLSYFVADYYAGTSQDQAAQTFLKAALESSRGIFIMRPQAEKLSKAFQSALPAP